MAGRRVCVLVSMWAASGCGGEQGSHEAAAPPTPFTVLAADRGPCTPISKRSKSPLVWCGALGGTCATAAVCDFIDGGPPRTAPFPDLPRGVEPQLTVFLRTNCRGVVSGATLFVDETKVDSLQVGPPGLTLPIEAGPHTVAAESPEGLAWEAFRVTVTARGLIQPLTCR